MDCASIFKTLRSHQKELEAMGVKELALFGTFARNQAQPDSNIDLLVEFNRPVGLFQFIEVQLFLEKVLVCKVDLVTRDALRPIMRDEVLSEAVYVTSYRSVPLHICCS